MGSGDLSVAGLAAGRWPNCPGLSVNNGLGDGEMVGDGEAEGTVGGELPQAAHSNAATRAPTCGRVLGTANITAERRPRPCSD